MLSLFEKYHRNELDIGMSRGGHGPTMQPIPHFATKYLQAAHGTLESNILSMVALHDVMATNR